MNLLNGTTLVGWFVFGVGMIFFWTMVMNSDFSYVNFRGEKNTTPGRITGVEETGAKESKRRVFAHRYEYSVGRQTLQGVSYATGSKDEPGRRVIIEYSPANPRQSRIRGMRPALFSSGAQFIAFIAIIGALLTRAGTRKGLRRNHLLQNGHLTSGTLIDRKPTNINENRRPVHELTFEFVARDGRKHRAVARSSEPARLEDEQKELLLYDPTNPEVSFLLDELPGRPELNAEGQFMEKPSAAKRALIIPLIVIIANIAFAFHRFM